METKLEIVQVPIADLKPADYNPRKWSEADVLEMIKSISRFGFVEPVIVNQHKGRENILIGGHMRVHCAKQLGILQVPAVFVNLDEDREKELNLRLNRNGGSFDYDMLANVFDVGMLQDVGFTEKELGVSFEALAGDGITPADTPDMQESLKALTFKFLETVRAQTKHRLEAVMLANGLDTKEDALLFLLTDWEKKREKEK